jgi:two-component system, chemotaxis family, chemotaxis protein CheY
VRQELTKSKAIVIQTAEDGKEAIDLIEKARRLQPYDLVFLDWNMPKMSGLEVLSYFRAQPEYDSTAFIMLTAESERHNIMTAIKAGATSYIVKPVAAAEVSKKLLEVLQWMKQRQSTRTDSAPGS